MFNRTSKQRPGQRGIALVTSLMIMLILTILGITVMNMTTLEEKMAFNTQDRYVARYLAESAILFMARNGNLPSPNEPGVSNTQFANLKTDMPQLAMDSATGQVIYVQSTAINNLVPINPKSTYLAGGVPVNDTTGESPNGGIPVFQFSAIVTTKAGTLTDSSRMGYFFAGGTTMMQ